MKTVGIVGCQPRIGTTTQALQLTLCLMHMGYNAAYVEMGERDYIEKLDALYQGITIDKNDIIYCQSIPLYTGSRIALANRGRYDYVIKDYGYIQPSVDAYNRYILDKLGITRDELLNNFILSKYRYEDFLSSSDKEKKDLHRPS